MSDSRLYYGSSTAKMASPKWHCGDSWDEAKNKILQNMPISSLSVWTVITHHPFKLGSPYLNNSCKSILLVLCTTTMCSTFAFPVWIGGSSLHICWGHYDVPLKWVTFRDPYIWVHFRQYVLKIRSGPIFCLLLGVSSDYAQPITGQVTKVTCPVIGPAQPELTPSKRQKMGLGDYA